MRNGDRMTGNEPERKSWVERWYRVMLLGYPARYRERHGGELLATLLESHPSRRLPSPRESASLLDAGMLTRFRGRLGKVPAWADGLYLGLFLLALTRTGTVLGDLLTTHQQPQLPLLLATLLVMAAVLLGRMGVAAIAAAAAAALTTYQALQVGPGTDFMAGVFSSRLVAVPSDSGFWLSTGPWQFWVIAIASAVLAVRGRGHRQWLRRSGWWLVLPLLEALSSSYGRTRLPTIAPPHPMTPIVPGSLLALLLLPMAVSIALLLLALRATTATGDPRWAIATGVYLIPIGIYAVALAAAQPGAIVTLDYELPIVLLAAMIAITLRRRAPRPPRAAPGTPPGR